MIVLIHWNEGHVAALLTLKANWLDTLTVQQWKVVINNDVVLFFCHQWGNTFWAALILVSKSAKKVEKTWINISQLKYVAYMQLSS